MKKILCVNNWKLDTFPRQLPGEVACIHQLAFRLKHKLLSPRFGRHTLPVDTKPLEDFFGTPENLATATHDNFAYTIDSRCHDLVQTRRDRPWVVWWSGGIDSTAIVTALLKHPETQFRDNVIICANEISISENPRFFYKTIVPNFQVMHGHDPRAENNIDYYHVSGALCDQLCGPDQALHMTGIDGQKSFREAGPDLVNQIQQTWATDGIWLYKRMIQHIESVPDAPVQTCADFFWWFNHTWPWYYVLLHERNGLAKNIKQMQQAKLQWYDTYEFHAWAWHRARVQFAESFARPERFKQELKDYTWAYTQDNYFRHFKTKSHSDSRKWPAIHTRYSDQQVGTWMLLDQDLNPYYSWDGWEDAVIEHFSKRI